MVCVFQAPDPPVLRCVVCTGARVLVLVCMLRLRGAAQRRSDPALRSGCKSVPAPALYMSIQLQEFA
eukprot:8630314-Lingulodinium_polyedra.AAC.1